MFINMLCHISQGIFLDPGHPLPSLMSSMGLQTALIRKTKHQETDVILMALSHYIPFLPSQNISYLLSWSFEFVFLLFRERFGMSLYVISYFPGCPEWHLTDCSAVFYFYLFLLAWEIWRDGDDWISSGKRQW